jgi:AcrR family transcriptional regulator
MAETATLNTRQRRKEARPQELLSAALALFVEKGFAATRSEEVAALAGVSKGTLYLYYPSKQDLFKAVVRHNLSALIAEGEELVDGFTGRTAELLECLMLTWWERVGSTGAAGIHKIMISEARNFPELAQFYTDEVIRPADRLFTRTVRRGVERGEFRPVSGHESAVAHALIAPMIFLSLCQHSIGACPVLDAGLAPDAVIRTQLDLMLRGLEVREPETIKPPVRTHDISTPELRTATSGRTRASGSQKKETNKP